MQPGDRVRQTAKQFDGGVWTRTGEVLDVAIEGKRLRVLVRWMHMKGPVGEVLTHPTPRWIPAERLALLP